MHLSKYAEEDDRVDVEDDSTKSDHIGRPEILYKEEGGHVDIKWRG